MDSLPSELWSIILQDLSSYHRARTCSVCKQFETISIGLIPNTYSNMSRLKAGDYHAIARERYRIEQRLIKNRHPHIYTTLPVSKWRLGLPPATMMIFMRLLREGEGSLAHEPLRCAMIDNNNRGDWPTNVLYAACRFGRLDIVDLLLTERDNVIYCGYLIGRYSKEPQIWPRLVSLKFIMGDQPQLIRLYTIYNLCGMCEANNVTESQYSLEMMLSGCSVAELKMILTYAKIGGNETVIDMIEDQLYTMPDLESAS